jgi:hypothetical protein
MAGMTAEQKELEDAHAAEMRDLARIEERIEELEKDAWVGPHAAVGHEAEIEHLKEKVKELLAAAQQHDARTQSAVDAFERAGQGLMRDVADAYSELWSSSQKSQAQVRPSPSPQPSTISRILSTLSHTPNCQPSAISPELSTLNHQPQTFSQPFNPEPSTSSPLLSTVCNSLRPLSSWTLTPHPASAAEHGVCVSNVRCASSACTWVL